MRHVGGLRPLILTALLALPVAGELYASPAAINARGQGDMQLLPLVLIIGAAAIVQTVLIVGLVLSIRRSRRLSGEVERELSFAHSLMEALPLPVFYKDLEGRYQRVNHAFAHEVIGRPVERIVGTTLEDMQDYGSQDVRDIHVYYDRQTAISCQTTRYSAYTPFADGRRHGVSISKVPVMDEHGRIRGLLGIVVDLSDMHMAQARVRRMEEAQQLLLDSLPVQVWFLTPQFTYRLANRSHRSFFGMDTAQIGHLSMEMAIPGAAGVELTQEVRRVAKTGVPSDVLIQTSTQDGRPAYLEVSIAPELNRAGNMSGLVCIASDTTAQVELRQQRDELSLALSQSPVSVVITDLQGRVTWVNHGCEEMTGYSATELIGQQIDLLNSGEHSSELYQDLWDRILTRASWSGQFHNRRKDGSLFWERATITPVYDENDEAREYIKVSEDITTLVEARTALENELQRSNGLLREVFHRSKNNLQILDSAVYLRGIRETEFGPAGRRFVKEIRSLIQAIAGAHDALDIWDDPDRVPINSYLESVLGSTSAMLGLTLSSSFAEAAVDIERALPAGIALNDLLTELMRASEHLPPLQVTGRIEGRHYSVHAAPEAGTSGTPARREGLAVLADAVVVNQLDGTLERETDGFRFSFPMELTDSR